MSFDQSVLIWCVIAPVVISTGAFFIGRLLNRKSAQGDRFTLGLPVFGLGWWSAIATALFARQGWPSDQWQIAVWPLLAWAALVIGSVDSQDRSLRWILTAVIAGATALLCLPRGEAWQDTYGLHGPWGVALTVVLLLNAWSLDRMARHGAERWVLLVALASLGGPLALAAGTYASLAEWSVAIVVATATFTAAGLLAKTQPVWSLAPLASAAGTCMIAAGRFQTFEEHPVAIYATMLLLPTIVAGVDLLIPRRMTWIRVSIAALISAVLVGINLWFLLLQETEDW